MFYAHPSSTVISGREKKKKKKKKKKEMSTAYPDVRRTSNSHKKHDSDRKSMGRVS